jgi:glycosyltransferase involved in cell wall biosynthesis
LKVALVENFGADFVGARLRYAVYLKNKGVDVTAIIPNDGFVHIVENLGIRVIQVEANIRSKGVRVKLNYAIKLRSIFKTENFDIIHFYRFLPNIIGTFIAGIIANAKIVNHVTGLGTAFTDKRLKNKFLQFVIKNLYGFNNLLFKPHTVFQNKEDIIELGFKKRAYCIEGSAVNQDLFNVNILEDYKDDLLLLKSKLGIIENEKVFIFISRLLKEKGILELIKASVQLNIDYAKPFRLLLVGWSDTDNPSAVSDLDLAKYVSNHSFINFLGKRSDVNKLIAISDIAILPSYYREGTPRFLLEAMAMGKPIITTNMPGCNHLVPDGNNGFLIIPRSIESITKAMTNALESDLNELGQNSHSLYHEKFSEEIVYNALFGLYISILKQV